MTKLLCAATTHAGKYIAGIAAVMIMLTVAVSTKAQDTLTADGLFAAARKTAFEKKNNTEAIRLAKKALELNPRYTDIVVFVGRVYTWEKQNDSARAYFETALEQNVAAEEAYQGYSDLEYWSQNYGQANEITQRGLDMHPYSQELLLRKAKILTSLKDYKTAVLVTDTLLTMNRHNAEARALNINAKELSYKNRFTFRHDHAHFDKQFVDDWYFGSLEYTRLTGIGPVVARLNYADRFKRDGLLMEADAYPQISKTFYMYLNLGFSNHQEVFPRWRSGASLFANLPHAFEAELGARYLRYTDDAFFYTAYLGKYLGSFMLGARTYITPSTSAISNANNAFVRYYFGGTNDYIHLSATAGISPDDRRLNLQVNSNGKLRSMLGELIFSKAIRQYNVVTFNFSLLNQEYFPGLFGNQYQGGFSYTRHF
ncbi:MAG: YaiO family outer membrane beta-barrel protein [Bacteroidota bacterium]